ncbi:hypothetical protein H0H87_011414 [Tephrocybe sp. NHM501043]|nr:hypothetical protein H0H87_011414 [Tephrocybe sp. NHM501043]
MGAGDQVQSFRQGIPAGFIPELDCAQAEAEAEAGEGLEGPESGEQAEKQSVSSSHSLALGILRTKTLKPGNFLPLKLMPPATVIHNITLKPRGRAFS